MPDQAPDQHSPLWGITDCFWGSRIPRLCGSALEASAYSFSSLLLGAPHQGPLLPKIQMKNFLLLVSLCFFGSARGECCLLALGGHGEASLRPLKTEDQHLSYPSDSEVGVAEQVQLWELLNRLIPPSQWLHHQRLAWHSPIPNTFSHSTLYLTLCEVRRQA